MKYVFYLFIFFSALNSHSQTLQKIKFQKNSSFIYFFPKNSADSVRKNTNDLFYLIVPDSLKKTTVVFVENGQILKTANDSLVRLNYLPGLKYESQFIIKESPDLKTKNLKREFSLISLINGPSSYQKNKILIQIVNKKEDKIVIENTYIYKN